MPGASFHAGVAHVRPVGGWRLSRAVRYDGPTIAVLHTLIALAVVTIVAGVVLHRSVLGRYLFAIGKNEEAPATPPSRHRASTAPSQFIAV